MLSAFLLVLQLAHASTDPVQPQSIYGTDDRREYYEMTSPLVRRHFRSVAAMFEPEYIKPGLGGADLVFSTAQQEANLCSSERFAQQIAAASCTAALVGPNIILTAGHCVKSQAECRKLSFAFDYLMSSPVEMPRRIPGENLYGCKRLLAREANQYLDYAFIELDRAVSNRPFFQFDVKHEVQTGERLFIIGSPIGLPLKIGDGYVRDSAEEDSFETNLDTYEGNSGSPVFSLQNGFIVGILVNGEDDFVDQGKCRVSKRCKDNECKGEQVARITSILADFYKKTRP